MEKSLEEFLYFQQFGLEKSEHTIKGYRTDLEQFIKYLNENEEMQEFTQITQFTFRSFMAYLNRNDISKRSINRKVSAIRSFFKYLYENKKIAKNYSKFITSPKFERNLPSVLTEKEVKSIISLIDVSKIIGVRDRAMIELLYSSGIRASELLGISEYLIRFEEREIRVIGKGEKERITFFSKTAREWMLRYITLKKELYSNYSLDCLFVNSKGAPLSDRSLRRIVGAYAKKSGIEKEISPHTFRHSFATHLLNKGVGIKYLQELMGHTSITTTQVYTRVSKEFLKEIYLKTHPFVK